MRSGKHYPYLRYLLKAVLLTIQNAIEKGIGIFFTQQLTAEYQNASGTSYTKDAHMLSK